MNLMFVKLVQNLNFAPGLASQLTFYVRRLRKEALTRKLSVFAGIGLALFQIAAMVAPPTASIAASTNDIIFGGFTSQAQMLSIYDHGLSGHHSAADIQAIFNYFGISRSSLAATTPSRIDTVDRGWYSLGRNPHFAQDIPYQIGGTTFYLRPTYLWDSPGTHSVYDVLQGRTSNGQYFSIMIRCGNLVFRGPPTIGTKPPPPPPPKPPPPPLPPEETSPEIHKAKEARYTQNGGDANGTQAGPGHEIEYKLLVNNSGNATKTNFVIRENIRDILEYGTLTNRGGGKLVNGILSWPAVNIKPNQTVVKKFRITIKSPIPATPRSISDPQSYDLRLDNVFGNHISITVPPPPPKQVELASQQMQQKLPQTGVGFNAALVFAFIALSVYFYSRNRQLITEVNILRAEQTHGGGK